MGNGSHFCVVLFHYQSFHPLSKKGLKIIERLFNCDVYKMFNLTEGGHNDGSFIYSIVYHGLNHRYAGRLLHSFNAQSA